LLAKGKLQRAGIMWMEAMTWYNSILKAKLYKMAVKSMYNVHIHMYK